MNYKLFFRGTIQVFFVVINTYFIAHDFYIGNILSSFMISFIWSFNVKSIAFGNNLDKVTYALGATTGTIIGILFSKFIVSAF